MRRSVKHQEGAQKGLKKGPISAGHLPCAWTLGLLAVSCGCMTPCTIHKYYSKLLFMHTVSHTSTQQLVHSFVNPMWPLVWGVQGSPHGFLVTLCGRTTAHMAPKKGFKASYVGERPTNNYTLKYMQKQPLFCTC